MRTVAGRPCAFDRVLSLCTGACQGGLLWGPSDGPPLTALAVADVKEVKEKNAAKLEGLPTDQAWDK